MCEHDSLFNKIHRKIGRNRGQTVESYNIKETWQPKSILILRVDRKEDQAS